MDTALACTPEGWTSPKWQALMGELGATPMGAAERTEAAERAGQTKGAPSAEVAQCLGLLVDAIRREVPRVAEVLAPLLDGIVTRHLEQYTTLITVPEETAAAEKPAGMFAFAMATAKEKSKTEQYQGGTYLLHCPECGAPRMRSADVVCEYCGGRTTH